MRRMIFSKRTLALILALMMTLSVVYVPAFATGSEEEAPETHVCDFSGEPHVVAPDHVNGKHGYTYFECQVEGCDKVHILESSLVDPDKGDHVWKTVSATAPTCTTAGNIEYKVCEADGCDVVADTEGNIVEGGVKAFEIPALGHKFTEWTVTTDYLCTDLHTSRECLACGFVESVEWNEEYHNYQPVFDDTYTAPLCNKDGKVTFVCVSEHESGIKCSAVQENVKIKRTNQHITYVVDYVAPTCTNTGMQEYHVCTMCGRNFSIPNSVGNQGGIASLETLVIPATGHAMSDFTRVEGAGCGVENNMISTCLNGCGTTEYATEDHAWGTPERLPNVACGVENNMKSTCALCGAEKFSTQGHNYVVDEEKSSTTDAYCERTVVTVEVCEYCQDTVKTTTTEVYHANVATLPAVEVTCIKDGLTEGKQCADCGFVITAQTVISSAELHAAHEAAGYHNAGVQAYKFPTCTEVGYTTGKKCTECDVVVEAPVELPATGHTYNTKEIAPTCQTVGYRVGGICENDYCDYVVPGKTIPVVPCEAKANKVLVSAATCTSPAIYKSECKWCETVLENITEGDVNPNNHSGTVAIDVNASVVADCLNDGYAFYACSDCDFVLMVIPNEAHAEASEYKNATLNGKPVTEWMNENEFKAEYKNVLTFPVTATGHNYPFPSIDRAPTCTEDGYQLWMCQNSGCEAAYELFPKATGHTPGKQVQTQAPTCTDKGAANVLCAVCNVVYDTVELDATGHATGEYRVTKNPTCTDKGVAAYFCPTCDVKLTEDEDVAPTGHSHNGNGVLTVVSPATCLGTGLSRYLCETCGVKIDGTEDVVVDPTGHKPGTATQIKAPTCVVDGEAEIRCTACNELLETVGVTAPGHVEYLVEEHGATCQKPAYKIYGCSVCEDHMRTEVIGAEVAHDYKLTESTATCTKDGTETYVCSYNCGSKYTNPVGAKGHTPGETVVENNVLPGCVNGGSYDNVVYCTVCDAELSRTPVTVNANGHKPGETVVENNVLPSCLVDGSYDNVVYCTVCNAELSRTPVTVDALGHKYNGYKSVVTLGTCDNGAGVYVKNCSVCDDETVEADSETVVFDTTVCDHGTLELVNGELVYVPVYGDNKNQTIDGSWTYVPHVHNNCQTGTVGGYICGICEEEEVIDSNYANKNVGDEIEATHDYTPVEHDATCMVEGYIEMVCDCGHTYTIDDSYHVADMNDKIVHTINGYSIVKVLASCDNVNGVYVEVCEDCGKTFETNVTYDATKGHGYIAIVNGELVYVAAYTDRNVSTDNWTYIPFVSNKCQEGTVGGWMCGICDFTEYENTEYAGKLIGSKIKPVHNLTANAQTPSCEGLGIEGWTYHEYCLDCDFGNDPVRDGWTVLPCTPCVVVTVPYKAATCTAEGNHEYSYKACCATKGEVAALAAAAVIPATNHVGTTVQIQTADATCTAPSFVYEVCTACNGEETFELISYIAPLGHNVVSANNGFAATCTVNGKESDKICDRCHDESTLVEGQVILAVGHTNAAGEHFLDTDKCAADLLGNDRHCVVCDADIDFTHRYDVQIFNATCESGEIHINTCVDCNTQKAMEVVRGPWTEEEHKAAIMGNKVDHKDPTPSEYGTDTYKCPHCDETIVVYLPLAGGIEFELDYTVAYPTYDDNGKITGFTKSDRKETANGTWIAVDVLVYGNKDFHFSQLDLSFKFNNNVIYFGSDMTTGIDNFVVESVVNDGEFVKISAGIDPNATTPYTFVDTVGEDAEGALLTTVYFMVAPEAGVGEASFSFEGNQNVFLADESTVTDITMFAIFAEEALTFTSVVLGDYNVDGEIDGVELLIIKQMINGRIDATYDLTLDLNKDGEITVVDYEIFKALVNYNNAFSSKAYKAVAGR